MMDIDDAPTPGEDPPNLKFLRVLVTILTATMIAGVLVIITLLVIRLREKPQIALPAEVTLPADSHPIAITQGIGWYAVVTEDHRMFVFDADSGKQLNEVQVLPE